MIARKSGLLPFLTTLLLLTGVHAALADVRDNAGFFSADAVRQANFDLRDVKQKYGKDLLIETYASVPAELQSQLNRDKDAAYEQWARQRGQETKLDGAVVLMTRQPSHLHVAVGDKTRQRAFTVKDRDQLRDQLITSFKQKDFDQGLLAAVRTFRDTVSTNLGGAGAAAAATPVERGEWQPPQSNPGALEPGRSTRTDSDNGSGSTAHTTRSGGGFSFGKLLLWGVLLIVGIKIISALLHRRSTPTQTPGGMLGGQPGYNRGGGGFGTGMGGGLLGGLLGGWLGGRMFGGGGSQTSYGAPPPPVTGGHEPGVFSSEHDQQFAGSGGDFGGGGGGTDFSGGGDFGGGGGGGDFGGGGGGGSGGGGDF